MTTVRTPINRTAKSRITPDMIQIFKTMQELETKCACEPIDWEKHARTGYYKSCEACHQVGDLDWKLRRLMRLPPWVKYAVQHPDWETRFPAGSRAADSDQPDLEAQERYRLLEAAVITAQGSTVDPWSKPAPPDR